MAMHGSSPPQRSKQKGYCSRHGICSCPPPPHPTGDVFTSIGALLNYYKRFETLRGLVQSTNLGKRLEGQAITIFVPTNHALKLSAGTLAKLPRGTVPAVLQYHVLPGYSAIRATLKPGVAYDTLFKGHKLSVKYTE
jgi:uncharacterized surface protein with fasciclin (FAS1) repeats